MSSQFFTDNGGFENYGFEHIISVFVCLLIGILIAWHAKFHKNRLQQKKIVVAISLCAAILQLAKVFIRLWLGNFAVQQDLPLHLCNILPFILPFAIILENRKLWAMLYFWIMAGTFQSLFTPTLTESFPHYEFFRYWIVHCGLVIAVLMPIYFWSHRIQWKDIIYAWLGINGLAFLMTIVNLILGSNYMYMMEKPPGQTMYDLLGPWPWYIVSLEFVSVFLFLILYLPFHYLPASRSHTMVE